MTRELEVVYSPREALAMVELAFYHLAGIDKRDLALFPDRELPELTVSVLMNALMDLKNERPVQYVTGFAEFFGFSFRVDERVLIPRPETEELVKWVVDDHRDAGLLRILDVGTGSGCIAIALKRSLPQCEVCALDSSRDALQVARENAGINRASVLFTEADIFHPEGIFPDISFDIIVSNPPYVTRGERAEMRRNVLDHEPESALFVPDEDPVLYYRAIAEAAGPKLTERGRIYVEINERFGEQVRRVFQEKGFTRVAIRRDMAGKPRMVCAGR